MQPCFLQTFPDRQRERENRKGNRSMAHKQVGGWPANYFLPAANPFQALERNEMFFFFFFFLAHCSLKCQFGMLTFSYSSSTHTPKKRVPSLVTLLAAPPSSSDSVLVLEGGGGEGGGGGSCCCQTCHARTRSPLKTETSLL